MVEISEEQLAIVQPLKNGRSVSVNAVAGSGKTTTCLHIAQKLVGKNILLLVYNRALCGETVKRVVENKIDNMDVHTFHSYCTSYYDPSDYTDKVINRICKKDLPTIKSPILYDVIIIDEVQDMKPLYYQLICKMVKDRRSLSKLEKNPLKFPQFCILGDHNQCIYQYDGSDPRFLLYADKLFDYCFHSSPMYNGDWSERSEYDKLVDYMGDLELSKNTAISNKWEERKLSISYRLTKEIADFVNFLLGETRVYPGKFVKLPSRIRSPKPSYIVCDAYDKSGRLAKLVEMYLKIYKPGDIMILAPSLDVKIKPTPISELENYLVKNHLAHVYVGKDNDDFNGGNAKVMQDKLLLLTFHKAKGLERKVVIVYNFDMSYKIYYHRDPMPICPNTLYVACTRASEKLILIHNKDQPFLPFLDDKKLSKLYTYVDMRYWGNAEYCLGKACMDYDFGLVESGNNKTTIFEVSQLLKLNYETIEKCMDLIHVDKKSEQKNILSLPSEIPQKDGDKLYYENVPDITGTAIHAIYRQQYTYPHGDSMGDFFKGTEKTLKLRSKGNSIRKKIRNREEGVGSLTIKDMFYLANCYCARMSGYLFKLYQVKNYNWVNCVTVEKMARRLKKFLQAAQSGINEPFKHEVDLCKIVDQFNVYITGTADCIGPHSSLGNQVVYELKTTKKLRDEHLIQLALYMFLHMGDEDEVGHGCLYNICSDESIQITCSREELEKLVHLLVSKKLSPNNPLQQPLGQFFDEMKGVRQLYGLV